MAYNRFWFFRNVFGWTFGNGFRISAQLRRLLLLPGAGEFHARTVTPPRQATWATPTEPQAATPPSLRLCEHGAGIAPNPIPTAFCNRGR
jgi:hypothetical protein